MTKTYTTKSNALRAAKSAGFTKEQVEILGSDAAFYFAPIGQTAADAVLADEVGSEDPTDAEIEESNKPTAPVGAALTLPVHNYVCPHCGTDLTNGVGEHLQDVNGKAVKHEKFQFECLACGEEFGPAIEVAPAPVEKKEKKARGPQVNSSTIERPCKQVWAIADEMIAKDPSIKRGAVLKECTDRGIAFYTARTQYQAWLAVRKEMATEVRATLPKNGL